MKTRLKLQSVKQIEMFLGFVKIHKQFINSLNNFIALITFIVKMTTIKGIKSSTKIEKEASYNKINYGNCNSVSY